MTLSVCRLAPAHARVIFQFSSIWFPLEYCSWKFIFFSSSFFPFSSFLCRLPILIFASFRVWVGRSLVVRAYLLIFYDCARFHGFSFCFKTFLVLFCVFVCVCRSRRVSLMWVFSFALCRRCRHSYFLTIFELFAREEQVSATCRAHVLSIWIDFYFLLLCTMVLYRTRTKRHCVRVYMYMQCIWGFSVTITLRFYFNNLQTETVATNTTGPKSNTRLFFSFSPAKAFWNKNYDIRMRATSKLGRRTI